MGLFSGSKPKTRYIPAITDPTALAMSRDLYGAAGAAASGFGFDPAMYQRMNDAVLKTADAEFATFKDRWPQEQKRHFQKGDTKAAGGAFAKAQAGYQNWGHGFVTQQAIDRYRDIPMGRQMGLGAIANELNIGSQVRDIHDASIQRRMMMPTAGTEFAYGAGAIGGTLLAGRHPGIEYARRFDQGRRIG